MDAMAVERAITLTGSARDAQALTCVQYLSQTWPLAGEYTMQVVKDVIANGYQGRKNGEFPDGTTFIAWRGDGNLVLDVSGTQDSIAELGEQLA